MSHLRDLLVAVVLAEVLQRPIGDVLAAVRAVLVVDVEGETLTGTARLQPRLAMRLLINTENGIWEWFVQHDHCDSRFLSYAVGKTERRIPGRSLKIAIIIEILLRKRTVEASLDLRSA